MDAQACPGKSERLQGTTTVVLVDDHQLAREGMRKILGNDASIEVVGEAESCWEAISLIARLRPGVVVLDVRLRDGSGVEVGRAVRRLAPDSRVLVLSAYDDSQYVVSMVKLGVSGYLTKTSSGEDLIRAVHHAAEGWLVFSPDIADKVASLLRRNGGALLNDGKRNGGYKELGWGQRSSESLTIRESEVLQQMFRGLRNRDIAEAMGISIKTVEVHMHRILLKLGARNRSQAIVKSIGMGYLQGVAVPAGPGDDAEYDPLHNVAVSPRGVEGKTR
ncbi:MAG: response regulator transcription factor [Dehalococcoidia bacterium]|nr:response regulator transcription factor [Dehalococcoidia bacterium]